MTDTPITDKSLKAAFTREKENRVDKVMEEAQRLVNLYHHVDVFGEEFAAQLDNTLLETSSEVQAALPNILGGSNVRQYIEFLKNNKKILSDSGQDGGETEVSPVMQEGYLPSPAEDEPMFMASPIAAAESGGINTAVIETMFKNFTRTHQVELERLLQAQTETLSQVMQRLDKNTHEVASHQTDRLISAIKQETGKQKEYSDVIESTSQTPVLVPDEMEGF